MLTGGRVMASGDVHTVMTAPMISRLYQTPTRRVEAEGGDVIFVPTTTAPFDEETNDVQWT
jgi:ABC-type cobalamin transport system ATPase subunit